jgi:hypothetical protein
MYLLRVSHSNESYHGARHLKPKPKQQQNQQLNRENTMKKLIIAAILSMVATSANADFSGSMDGGTLNISNESVKDFTVSAKWVETIKNAQDGTDMVDSGFRQMNCIAEMTRFSKDGKHWENWSKLPDRGLNKALDLGREYLCIVVLLDK